MRDKIQTLSRANDLFRRLLDEEVIRVGEGQVYITPTEDKLPVIAPLGQWVCADALARVSRGSREFPVSGAQIRLNIIDFADFRKWGVGDGFEIETQPPLRALGLGAFLWGAIVIIDPDVLVGQVLVIGERPEAQDGEDPLDPERIVVISITR